jgi:hypothetical protein
MDTYDVIFEINAGLNLLQGTIPDYTVSRVCNTQGIEILTGDGKWRFSGGKRR